MSNIQKKAEHGDKPAKRRKVIKEGAGLHWRKREGHHALGLQLGTDDQLVLGTFYEEDKINIPTGRKEDRQP